VIATLSSCVEPGPVVPQRLTFKVLNVYPHDPAAVTQGLVIHDGILYEGTGRHGESSLRRVELESGTVLQRHDLDEEYFGEGVAVVGGRIFQLTWKACVAIVYDRESFEEVQRFSYHGEGWGLTHDGKHLIMSDGTDTLRFLDPATFREVRRVIVCDKVTPVRQLNELEYIQGKVYANVWQTDRIARIDPETGAVTAWIDLTGLLPAKDRRADADVLNGIAYDAENGRLFVTGKRWPKLFEIELGPAQDEGFRR
jgi:glutaminyl-peptide cyclotransferase